MVTERMIHHLNCVEFGRAVLDQFLLESGGRLTERESEMATAWSRNFVGLCEIPRVKPSIAVQHSPSDWRLLVQMDRHGLILLVVPLCLAAQAEVPTINPDGIVRSDTTRTGILPPGMVFSIWGHNYGPKAGCKGTGTEACGVQVLLDGEPIEVQYTNDVLVNARMPEGAPKQPVSRLVVVSGGRRSDPVEVRRLPDTAVISLDGDAHVDGPVWIRVELPRSLGVSYPSLSRPWDFACDAFEVRKDGKPLDPIPHPPLGMAYSGPSCPGTVNRGDPASSPSRLPLHLQYNFSEPGDYEVRLLHYGDFGRRANDVRMESVWTRITVQPAVQRTITTHPQEPNALLRDFLPNLLALRDDQALRLLEDYLYHASPRVRSYAADALYYWPDSVIEPQLLEVLRANGPSAVVVRRLGAHASEVAEAAIPYFFTDDLVLFQGAIAAASVALSATPPIDPQLRARIEERVIAAVNGNLWRADAQTTNDLIVLLGQVHTERAHDLLWSLADRRTGTSQALPAIAWQKDAKDLPRLAALLIAAPADNQSDISLASVPNVMRAQFGADSIPALKDVMANAKSPVLRVSSAEELIYAKDPAGFAFALDAVQQNRQWKMRIARFVNDQFPETRNTTDVQLSKFLADRSQ